MPYTSDKKPGALDAALSLGATNNLVVDQNGSVVRASLSQLEAKMFDVKTAKTLVDGSEVVIVRQTDDTLRQVPLNNIVKNGLISNDLVSSSAGIVDTKLATINTAGKVTNQAVQATALNTADRIVTRDGSGNFAAGTVTATLSGNASTATTLQTGRTVAISGDVTGTATSFNGSANITIPAVITAGVIVDADVNANAAIGLSKLDTGALPTGITVASANIVDGTIINEDINASANIVDTKLATIATAGKVANTATTATNANTASAIVARDASGNFTAGTITATLLSGNVTGNSTTATTLATGRTIALTGDVTGTTGSFNGSANVSAATTIVSNAVTTAKIADANVTTAKIADSNVTTAKIANDAVTTAKILNANVTTAKIADGAITAAKIDPAAKIGGATGAGTDRTFYENDQSVNTNYTISTSKNAMSAGPITVESGVSVTVPNGSTWTIV